VFLSSAEAVEAVKKYIDAHNLRRGLPAEPFPWITRQPSVGRQMFPPASRGLCETLMPPSVSDEIRDLASG
jgi:hypothetical protein